MKQGSVRTLRGTIETSSAAEFYKKQLILDDGLINQGYRIEAFMIWPTDFVNLHALNRSQYAQLATDLTPQTEMFGKDNRQIAWSMMGKDSQTNVIDPDHIVNRDLYLRAYTNGNNEEIGINYLIVMRKYTLTDDEAIVTIVKEESQSSD